MPGWVEVRYYVREILIYLVAVMFLEIAFNSSSILHFFHTPPALVLLFSAMIPIIFIGLGAITLSFLRFVPTGILGGYHHEPTTWEGVKEYQRKYRRYIFSGAAVNALYFLALGIYFLGKGGELSSERMGVIIFSLWVIMNCMIVVAFCFSFWVAPAGREAE